MASDKPLQSTANSPSQTASGLSGLPPELRLDIWRLTLPEDESEVCILWPINLGRRQGPSISSPSTPLVVDTGYPVAMHVCRESRHLATTSGNLRFRFSPAAGFAVPCRRFNASLDVLYWGGEDFVALARAMPLPWMAEVRRLAVDLRWAVSHSGLLLRPLAHRLDGLRRVLLVLPDAGAAAAQPFSTRQYFRPPARRCRLHRMEGARAAATEIDPSAGTQLCETASLQQCVERAARDLEADTRRRGGAGGGVRIEPAAFVFTEYQRDGSWREGCADRTFVRWGRGSDAVRSGKYIPVEERPHPEEMRVNDLDGDF